MARGRRNTAASIWDRVERRGPDECWRWLGSHSTNYYSENYGQDRRPAVSYDGRNWYVYRLIYQWTTGEELGDRFARHSCDNPSCVNPAHVVPGTAKDNSADMMRRGRAIGPRGEKCWKARLTNVKVRAMRAEHAAGASRTELMHRYGVSRTAVALVVRRSTWKHVADEATP